MDQQTRIQNLIIETGNIVEYINGVKDRYEFVKHARENNIEFSHTYKGYNSLCRTAQQNIANLINQSKGIYLRPYSEHQNLFYFVFSFFGKEYPIFNPFPITNRHYEKNPAIDAAYSMVRLCTQVEEFEDDDMETEENSNQYYLPSNAKEYFGYNNFEPCQEFIDLTGRYQLCIDNRSKLNKLTNKLSEEAIDREVSRLRKEGDKLYFQVRYLEQDIKELKEICPNDKTIQPTLINKIFRADKLKAQEKIAKIQEELDILKPKLDAIEQKLGNRDKLEKTITDSTTKNVDKNFKTLRSAINFNNSVLEQLEAVREYKYELIKLFGDYKDLEFVSYFYHTGELAGLEHVLTQGEKELYKKFYANIDIDLEQELLTLEKYNLPESTLNNIPALHEYYVKFKQNEKNIVREIYFL